MAASGQESSPFETNFYMIGDGEEDTPIAPATPLLCAMCEEDHAKTATHLCQKCLQPMCRTCRRLHDKVTDSREHLVRALNSEDAAQLEVRSAPKCLIHRDQDLCFFCKDCDITICLHCKLTSHQPHVTEDMTSAALREKGQMAELVTTAQKQVEALEKAISRLARDEREVARQRQEVTDEVSAHYDAILRWVNRSREELLEAITAKSESAISSLRAEENQAKKSLETLSRLLTSFSTSDTSPEILILKNEFQASLLGDDVFSHFSKMGDLEKQKIFLHLTSDPSVLDLGMIRTYMGEINSSNKKTPDVPLKEQVLQAKKHAADVEGQLRASEKTLQQDFEAKLKAMEQKLQQALQALQTKQQSTEKLAQEVKTATASLETNMSTQIRSAKDQFEKSAATLEAKLKSTDQLQKIVDGSKVLETKMQAAESRLDTVQKRVAFNVWHSTNPLSVQGFSVLVMDYAPVNIGNGYSTSTGIFTCPLPGLYNLQATIMTHVSHVKKVYAGMYIDDAVYAMSVADSTHGFWDQSTVRVVLHLKKDQKVCLKNLLGSPATYYSAKGQPYTSFSGFLIQAD